MAVATPYRMISGYVVEVIVVEKERKMEGE